MPTKENLKKAMVLKQKYNAAKKDFDQTLKTFRHCIEKCKDDKSKKILVDDLIKTTEEFYKLINKIEQDLNKIK